MEHLHAQIAHLPVMAFVVEADEDAKSGGSGRGGYGDIVLRNQGSCGAELRVDVGVMLGNLRREGFDLSDGAQCFESRPSLGGLPGRCRETYADECLSPNDGWDHNDFVGGQVNLFIRSLGALPCNKRRGVENQSHGFCNGLSDRLTASRSSANAGSSGKPFTARHKSPHVAVPEPMAGDNSATGFSFLVSTKCSFLNRTRAR